MTFSRTSLLLASSVAFAVNVAAGASPRESGLCRVTGRVFSSEYAKVGGGIERAIAYAYRGKGGDRVDDVSAKGETFELRLAPGTYRIQLSAVGTRGATFDFKQATVVIEPGQRAAQVPDADLPVSKTTRLYGAPAPELDGAVGWKNTQPGKLRDLRGRVVVLDFFAHYCSICHAHAPDLARIAQKYRNQGVAVLAVHDDSVKSIEEMDERMKDVPKKYWGGKDLAFPTVLDGGGDSGIFRSYGIGAVPAMILIDQQGRVVRRLYNAADPEFEKEIQRLLAPRPRRR
jgi:thiol-disulfide isomerase/thioredoxin